MNNKKVVSLLIVTFILAYMLGFSQGQFSVYKKISDENSLDQVYEVQKQK